MATVTAHLSPAEYLAAERLAEDKHEYIDGELRPMAGASRLHNLIVLRLAAILDAVLAGKPFEAYVNDMRVRIPDGPYYYPDAVAAPAPPQLEDAEQDTLLNPLLVVEVLSPSTEFIDRGEKLDNYRLIPSLTDYLIVSQDRIRIDHYTRLSDTEWRLVTYTDAAAIPLTTLNCTLNLQDIYARWQQEQSRPE
jgi:Uma2 family endonuclease